jgi:hypothetical protein
MVNKLNSRKHNHAGTSEVTDAKNSVQEIATGNCNWKRIG